MDHKIGKKEPAKEKREPYTIRTTSEHMVLIDESASQYRQTRPRFIESMIEFWLYIERESPDLIQKFLSSNL